MTLRDGRDRDGVVWEQDRALRLQRPSVNEEAVAREVLRGLRERRKRRKEELVSSSAHGVEADSRSARTPLDADERPVLVRLCPVRIQPTPGQASR
jgi:hypothetical protein